MKSQFNVPVDSIVEFTEILTENELSNEIVGINPDNELIIEVLFEKEDFDAVEELEELLETDQEEESEEEE